MRGGSKGMEWGNVPLVAVVHPGEEANDIRCTLCCFTSWSHEKHGAVLPFMLRSLVDEAHHTCAVSQMENGLRRAWTLECVVNAQPIKGPRGQTARTVRVRGLLLVMQGWDEN